MMLEWPGRCRICNQQIENWADAGLDQSRWVHKECYSSAVIAQGAEAPALRSPVDRSKVLEWPMLVSLLFFHFGVAIGFIGWIMLTQDTTTSTDSIGYLLLIIGLITPVAGIIGIALNVLSRRRIELVRQALELSGGWKPSR